MDQPSELAQIMRTIYEEGTQRKSMLLEGKLDPAVTESLFKMITATPTKPHMKGEGFEPYAQSFIRIYDDIHQASTVEEQIEAHNNMVTTCIACHKQFCDGPISKIESLYIQ
jgi:cytochrome c553